MATLQDVADLAGVSISTVSRIISQKGKFTAEVCNRVNDAIASLQYRPNYNARALASNKSNFVGIITPNISAPFYGSIAAGCEIAVNEMKYRTLIANSFRNSERELEAIHSFQSHGCEHIVMHSLTLDDKTIISLAEEIPGFVLLGRFIPEIANRCVWLDNVNGGKIAADYLINQGHREFGVITYWQQLQDPKDRIMGINQSLNAHGLTLNENAIELTNGEIADGKLATRRLLASGQKITAIIAYNDLIAVGAINELFDQGIRVPEDISVIGFDNLIYAETCRPQLTTVEYPIIEMARYAVELSIGLVENKNKYNGKTHLFMPKLVHRQSIGLALNNS